METKVKTRTYYGEYTIEHWIKLILSQNIILPEYQRSFVWDKEKVENFLSSLASGDYIPPITLAAGKEGDNTDVNLILDGQQRLTSILLAELGYMPCRKEFRMKEMADEELDDELDDEDTEKVEQKANTSSIQWSMKIMLGKEKYKDVKSLKDDLKKEHYEESALLPKKIKEEDFKKLRLGFLYIVPNGNDQDIQQLLAKLFRSINYDGAALSKEESRKALYYQNPEYSNLFEGKLDNGEDVLCDLSIAQGAVGTKKIDWLRFLSILSQYTVKNNKVLTGYRKESSREDFYSDFVAYIIGLSPLKGSSSMFEGIKKKELYQNKQWSKRYSNLREQIHKIKNLISSGHNGVFPSWIDADFWLFGLIYHVLFKNKSLTEGHEQELEKAIKNKIEKAKKENKHKARPNDLTFLRQRLEESIKIYSKHVS